MNRKIGILTYHNNSNRGSILQAYCLWKSLCENVKNSDIKIIDYRTLSKEIEMLFSFNPKIILKKINDLNTWKQFFKNNNSLSSEKIITNNHNKAIAFLKRQNYDMLIVGSDQIWRLEKRKNIFPTNRPFPNAYFLDPSMDSFKVSYAASANRMKIESLSNNEINIIKKHLCSFDGISVRDTHTEKFLLKLGISKIKIVPDPTLLVDIPKVDLKKYLQLKGIDIDKPILCIDRIDPKLAKLIINKYHSKGFQIVSPTYYGDIQADNVLYDLKPLEYFSLFQYFDMVVTRSYHSTIFSIKNKIPFISIEPSPLDCGDKGYFLLNKLSLLDRYIFYHEKNFDTILKKIETLEHPLNEFELNMRLKKFKKTGIEYIKEIRNMLYEK